MEIKKDIIRQLKALDKVHSQKIKQFDPTQIPDHGLLNQMSLLELRERLTLAKQRAKQEEDCQRQRILDQKEEKNQKLKSKVYFIQRLRQLSHVRANVRLQSLKKKEEEEEVVETKYQQQQILVTAQKLQYEKLQQQKETKRLVKEELKTKAMLQQQAAGAFMVEVRKFEDLRHGAEREIVSRQSSKLTSQQIYEDTQALENNIRAGNVSKERQQKAEFIQSYNNNLASLKIEHKEEEQLDKQRRKMLFEKQKQKESLLRRQNANMSYKPTWGKKKTKIQARLESQAESVGVV